MAVRSSCLVLLVLLEPVFTATPTTMPGTPRRQCSELSFPTEVPPVPDDWPQWAWTDRSDRFNSMLSHLQFHLVPKLTPTGFEKQRMPPDVFEMLRDLYDKAEPTLESLPQAKPVNVVIGPNVFADITSTANQILNQLKPLHEAWSNLTLVPTSAYGLRFYQNDSVLVRHVDRVDTHVVSSIMHVGRSDDADPWPLVIEDHHGVAHAVTLEPGEMLFYESARLPHARPQPFRGQHFTSLFVHYKPIDWPLRSENITRHLPANWDRNTVPHNAGNNRSYVIGINTPYPGPDAVEVLLETLTTPIVLVPLVITIDLVILYVCVVRCNPNTLSDDGKKDQ
eukprot:m.237484 g.237484  ORF g.237484 m.237484 type:complete len:337 (+) comp18954_c0_seq2:1511-2521(+)